MSLVFLKGSVGDGRDPLEVNYAKILSSGLDIKVEDRDSTIDEMVSGARMIFCPSLPSVENLSKIHNSIIVSEGFLLSSPEHVDVLCRNRNTFVELFLINEYRLAQERLLGDAIIQRIGRMSEECFGSTLQNTLRSKKIAVVGSIGFSSLLSNKLGFMGLNGVVDFLCTEEDFPLVMGLDHSSSILKYDIDSFSEYDLLIFYSDDYSVRSEYYVDDQMLYSMKGQNKIVIDLNRQRGGVFKNSEIRERKAENLAIGRSLVFRPSNLLGLYASESGSIYSEFVVNFSFEILKNKRTELIKENSPVMKGRETGLMNFDFGGMESQNSDTAWDALYAKTNRRFADASREDGSEE